MLANEFAAKHSLTPDGQNKIELVLVRAQRDSYQELEKRLRKQVVLMRRNFLDIFTTEERAVAAESHASALDTAIETLTSKFAEVQATVSASSRDFSKREELMKRDIAMKDETIYSLKDTIRLLNSKLLKMKVSKKSEPRDLKGVLLAELSHESNDKEECDTTTTSLQVNVGESVDSKVKSLSSVMRSLKRHNAVSSEVDDLL
jgi:hypothetical protein